MRVQILFIALVALCSCKPEHGPSTFTKECDSMKSYPTVHIKPSSVSDSDSIVVRIFDAGNGFKDEKMVQGYAKGNLGTDGEVPFLDLMPQYEYDIRLTQNKHVYRIFDIAYYEQQLTYTVNDGRQRPFACPDGYFLTILKEIPGKQAVSYRDTTFGWIDLGED